MRAMSLSTQSSLFAPAGGTPVGSSLDWIGNLLFGEVAIGICVLAVAAIGALMLTGRLALREGFYVVIGCFVLLGAPTIAAGLMAAMSGPGVGAKPGVDVSNDLGPRDELEPARRDPYSGA